MDLFEPHDLKKANYDVDKIEESLLMKSNRKFLVSWTKNAENYIATKDYKTQNKKLYDEFIKHNVINSTRSKYMLDYYIKERYNTINKIFESEKYTDLVANKVIEPYNKFFTEKQIHNKINTTIDFKNYTTKGTFFDGALSYLYDPSINYFEYISASNDDDIKTLLKDKNIKDANSFITEVFGNQVHDIKQVLDGLYNNLKSNMIVYNHSFRTYANPDLMSDDVVIDIKISKNKKIVSVNNYIQILSYGVLMNIPKICLYDMENGIIYEGMIINILELREYFYPTMIDLYENREYELEDKKMYLRKH